MDDNLLIFEKDTWYTIDLVIEKLRVNGKNVAQLKNVVNYYVRFDKEQPIDYHTILLKTIRYPTSFWKMFKLWRRNRRNGLCR